ncbi:MAG: hypothetical protein ACTTKZ_00980 [Bacteroides sp.]
MTTKKRKITTNEWILIAMIAVGILLVILRWKSIAPIVTEAFKAYFC